MQDTFNPQKVIYTVAQQPLVVREQIVKSEELHDQFQESIYDRYFGQQKENINTNNQRTPQMKAQDDFFKDLKIFESVNESSPIQKLRNLNTQEDQRIIRNHSNNQFQQLPPSIQPQIPQELIRRNEIQQVRQVPQERPRFIPPPKQYQPEIRNNNQYQQQQQQQQQFQLHQYDHHQQQINEQIRPSQQPYTHHYPHNHQQLQLQQRQHQHQHQRQPGPQHEPLNQHHQHQHHYQHHQHRSNNHQNNLPNQNYEHQHHHHHYRRHRRSKIPQGLNKQEIDQLIEIKFSMAQAANWDEECKKCSICLSDFTSNDKIRFLPCLHRFHVTCIDVWLQGHNQCPLCKKDVKKLMKQQ